MFIAAPFMTAASTCAASCCASLACEGCKCVYGAAARRSARFAYCFLFALSLAMAWVLRDYGPALVSQIPWVVDRAWHIKPSPEWFGKQAVLRISLGNALFFGGLALATLGVRNRSDWGDEVIHHGSWVVKLAAWLGFNLLPFFFPAGVLTAYAWLARAGSGIFLVLQFVLLLDFCYSWNENWVTREHPGWVVTLLAISASCYAASIAGTVFLYRLFQPAGAGPCRVNVFLVTLTVLLCAGFSVLSMLPAVRNGSLLPSALITLYSVYLTYSALSSEPRDYICNGLAPTQAKASQASLIVGVGVTLLSTVYSAVRAGSATDAFSMERESDAYRPLRQPGTESEAAESGDAAESGAPRTGPVSYNYSFFHLIFCLASMYTAMLLTGWGSADPAESDLVGVGWTSVWVKMASQWIAVGLYGWTLIAPLVLSDRDF